MTLLHTRRRGFAPDPTWVLLPVCAGVYMCKASVPHCFAVGAQSAGALTGPEAEQQQTGVFCGEGNKCSASLLTSNNCFLQLKFVYKIVKDANHNFSFPKAS